ncbi:MAG: GH3 auxin-responsive promoter family protein [Bacteroidia bacterium]|nr:GH3 auxin-responsive promoter family protein [Bacteroidia bacterium]
MAILGKILKRTINIGNRIQSPGPKDAWQQQKKVLKKLLTRAEYTAFGEQYGFTRILNEKDYTGEFRKSVPAFDYNSIFKSWWYRALNGESFVCWPGQIRYFALSSGTSESSSKHIPVTKDMLKAIQRTSVRQLLSQAHYDLPSDHFEKGVLLIGGSTHLNYNGSYYEGDLSGITAGNLPFWFQHFYKPGRQISRERDWNNKLEEIVRNAREWDIACVCGVPAWIQILLERIISEYHLSTIHDLWPNLRVYVTGGVSFEPYRNGFDRLMGKPMIYMETYLASEGFIAYQDRPDSEGMRLVTDNGIFYEFIPFNSDNFDADGTMVANPVALTLNEIEPNTEYALLMSTCSGAWRYLIGDTIRFLDTDRNEIVITGRTKHFLSLCGEHLSQDNMNKAISMICQEMNIDIKEFTVEGIEHSGMFAHQWYIGTNDAVDPKVLKARLDENLKTLNDDYRVERIAALKDVFIKIYPPEVFYGFMEKIGKIGGQHKFPRVLKKNRVSEWKDFLKDSKETMK